MILRHLLSVLFLPVVMVVVVPYWLMSSPGNDPRWTSGSLQEWLGRITGVVLFLGGFALVSWCARLFATRGKGTLAPWDPPRKLVVDGPYRHVRNPMISGVLAMIAGEALFLGSQRLAWWFAAFLAINTAYFLISEEPGLERRFGKEYIRYKAAVPRWIPRVRPWKG